ncbi:trichohyalin-like [Papaver somniferum]|uniref:trichohyalin-like n=1 Tax=Papaver somniferum TaxID=3469 RepID=UPI000E6FBB65|nr:trichohyalin-like [Papaver somniferum]
MMSAVSQGKREDLAKLKNFAKLTITESGEEIERERDEEIEGTIHGNEEIKALEEFRERMYEERRIEAEERANLTRQNHELRMENIRLLNLRPGNATKSNSGSIRGETRRNAPISNVNTNEQHQMDVEAIERYCVEQAYLDDERQKLKTEEEDQELQEIIRQNNHDNRKERRKQHRNSINNEEFDRMQSRIGRQRREITRNEQNRREEDEARNHTRDQEINERENRRRRKNEDDREEAHNLAEHDKHERRRREMRNTITMTKLREFQEEYIVIEEKQNREDSYSVANNNSKMTNASLIPRLINTMASTSQIKQEKMMSSDQQKLVATGSRDQEEFERERNFYNRGANNKIQRLDQPQENYGGQRKSYNRG